MNDAGIVIILILAIFGIVAAVLWFTRYPMVTKPGKAGKGPQKRRYTDEHR